jgi:hypothetical protein
MMLWCCILSVYYTFVLLCRILISMFHSGRVLCIIGVLCIVWLIRRCLIYIWPWMIVFSYILLQLRRRL